MSVCVYHFPQGSIIPPLRTLRVLLFIMSVDIIYLLDDFVSAFFLCTLFAPAIFRMSIHTQSVLNDRDLWAIFAHIFVSIATVVASSSFRDVCCCLDNRRAPFKHCYAQSFVTTLLTSI